MPSFDSTDDCCQRPGFLINPCIALGMPGVQFVNLFDSNYHFFLRLLYISCQKIPYTCQKKTDPMHCDDPSPIVAEEFMRPGTEGSGQEGVLFLL